MRHKHYREWLRLSIYDELNDEQKRLLEGHLQVCSDCRTEIDALRKTQAAVSKYPIEESTTELLQEARRALRSMLARANRSTRNSDLPVGWIDRLVYSGYRLAFTGAAILLAGFILGYGSYSFIGSHPKSQTTIGKVTRDFDYGQIQNVQFIHPGFGESASAAAVDRDVEFTFEMVRQVRMKGKLDDPQIQKIFAIALVNERNPGVRLESVSAINASNPNAPDPEIRSALIDAMKCDENPGVRMQAMETLKRYPYHDSIKKAFLYVLMNDRLSGLRIQAIDALVRGSMRTHLNDGETRKAFKEKLVHDENSYIRLQATTIVKENSL